MTKLQWVLVCYLILLSLNLNAIENPSIEKKHRHSSLTKDSLWGFSSKGREVFEVITSNGNAIQLVDVDGLAYSGDMIIGYTDRLKKYGLKISVGEDFPNHHKTDTQGATIYPSSGYKWRNGLVPYVFASNLSSQSKQDMQYAINHWNRNTNLRFIPRTDQRDYISISDGSGCSSWIGKKGGKQKVTLANGCGRGAAVHELGHAIGFFHEQARTDRDTYVYIYWENIRSDMIYNFEKMSAGDGDNYETYDFRSIMHYRSDSFGINGATTIWPKVSDIDTDSMGRGTKLSSGDIAAAASIYGGVTTPPSAKIQLSKSTYLDNEDIVVNFDDASGDTYDWIGLYRESASNLEFISWQYLNGSSSGSVDFSPLSSGNYQARLFFNDSYYLEASAVFSVESEDQSSPFVTTSKPMYSLGEDIVVRFRNASKNQYDWVGLYALDAQNSEYISWRYLRQRSNGTVTFSSLPAGPYSVRMFFSDSYLLEADSDFNVTDN